jgi:hypothetical protein
VLRTPTYRAKGRRALRKGREFVRALNTLTEESPRTLKRRVDVVSDQNKTSPNGSGGGAHHDAGERNPVATTVRREGDMELSQHRASSLRRRKDSSRATNSE